MNWVIETDGEWKIICKICGKSFNKLWAHLKETHKLLTSDYRKQFWLDQKARLMSESSIALASKRNKENYDRVVTDNLIAKWVDTRFKVWDVGRTKDKIREQTKIRLSHKQNKQWTSTSQ